MDVIFKNSVRDLIFLPSLIPVSSPCQSRRKTNSGTKKLKKKDMFSELLYMYIYIYLTVCYIRKRHLAHWISIGCASSSVQTGFSEKNLQSKGRYRVSSIDRIERWLYKRIAAKIIYHDSSNLSTIHVNQFIR